MNSISTIKEMKEEYRPYEKCMAYGPEVLSDQELLAVIIKTGSKGNSSVNLAERILSLTKNGSGLLGIMHLSVEELMEVNGIGKVKALQLKCVMELSKRIAKADASSSLDFSNPDTIADYYMEDLRHEEKEHLVVTMLDTKMKFAGDIIMTTGTVNSSLVSTREIFIEALKRRAVYIVLIHNHPSGSPAPSRDDIRSTKQVKEAGELIGITLLDHIIIGDNRYTSMRKNGIL